MPADIRLASMADVDALTCIEDAAFDGDRLSRRSFRHLIGSSSAAVLVADDGSRLLGYAAVLFRKGAATARLYSIAMAPGERGRGNGRSLLAAAEASASARHAASLRLEVRSGNDRARRLYELSGYRRIGSIPGYYHDGAAAERFEKPLGRAQGLGGR
ncbi:MAG: GNAT family N-acetyltransferase [Mesorhizobium sp.]|jgi:ribosomal protein S18 acetylase RimI-like enzyme